MGYTLAVERSTPQASWALYRDATLVAARPLAGTQLRAPSWVAEIMAGLVELGVAPGALERVIVGTGPGSFSGIRAAIAALQGLALPSGRPVLGLASAAALGRKMALATACATVAVVGDARRERLWCAVYRLAAEGRLTLASSGEQPGHTSDDFLLPTWATLSASIPGDAWVISPDWERLAARFLAHAAVGCACHAAAAVPTAEDLGALYFSDPSAARHDPAPIYLHPAVA